MSRRWTDPAAPGRHRSAGATWGDGYVVDTPYFEPVAVQVSPAWLSMVAVLHGQPPLDLSRPLTWLDLGAASGISAATIAATNPTVDVWGVDHNPGHVERGRSLAARASLENCHFEEASFADLATDDRLGPPEADVIVVSGVYSWISAANQGHVREVIRRRLRPGGLAYVMYESAWGWSSMVPLAEALRLLADADGRRPDLAFHDAAAVLQRLADGGAASFPLGSHEQGQMDRWPTVNGLYAAHEYLGANFGPLLFDDVASAMADARCSYVGQVDTVDHLPAYWAPPTLADTVQTAPDVVTRESYRDLIGQRALRQDLYRRGLAMSTVHQQEAALAGLTVVGLGRPFEERPLEVLGGGVSLDPAYYEPLVGALADRPLDAATISTIHTDWSFGDAASALAMLVAGGYAAPVAAVDPTPDAVAASHRLTDVLIAEDRQGADHPVACSPVLGSAVEVDLMGMLALGDLADGAEAEAAALAGRAVDELARQDRLVREHDELITDVERATAVAAGRVERVLGLRRSLRL